MDGRSAPTARGLQYFHDTLLCAYGPQHWWPTQDAEQPRFEVLVGAVLTQHTAWTNVERAIGTLRAAGPLSPVFRHIGLYGFRMAALERFASLPVGHYEELEGLEQLRFLENGMSIMTVAVEPGANAMWGIDTPEDATFAETLIAEQGDPMDAPR